MIRRLRGASGLAFAKVRIHGSSDSVPCSPRARIENDVAKKKDSLLDDLGRLPWWVSVALAAVVFVGLTWVVPWLFADVEPSVESLASSMFAPLAAMAPSFAPFAAVLLLPAAVSAIRQWKERQKGNMGDYPPIHLLDWKEFESLVGDYLRHTGLRVQPTGDGADGGVDLRATSDSGQVCLVQCKHWGRSRKVGVKVVRELYGVMAAESADAGAIVTSGSFTAEAVAFANGKPVRLVNGSDLKAMITEVRRTAGAAKRSKTTLKRIAD